MSNEVPPAGVQIELARALPRPVGSVLELVGNTPLLRLGRLEAECPGVQLWAKAEFCNPGGSVKDRAATRIIRDALARGDLGDGVRLIDSTSGNTGIAYSMVGAALGIPISLVMPENASLPRKQVTTTYGAELIFSAAMDGSDGAIRKCRQLVADFPERYYYPNQYASESNWKAHYDTTALEIWQQTGDNVTHFVTGVGTSGTVVGTSRRLHELDPSIRCIGMQPDDAWHGLEGLKHIPSSIVPPIYDASVLDETIWMPTEEGWDVTERVLRDEGLFVGHSAGANVAAALRVGKRLHAEGRTGCIVTVLCDRGDRYFGPQTWEKHYVW